MSSKEEIYRHQIASAIGLLNSMVLSGEQHTASSEAVVQEARQALDAIAEPPIMAELSTCRETLAECAHDSWSGWMTYLFSKSENNEDGTVTIPKWAVDRWSRQATTKYSGLSDDEKDSDRAEADKMIDLLRTPTPRTETE